jgi:hypothetical protein
MSERPDGHGQAQQEGGAARGRAHAIKHRLLDEFKRFVLLFLYLWIIFGLFVLNERIILQQQGINYFAQGFALVNALILAKVMLVVEDLNLGRWLDHRPLIYRIVHDSVLLTALFIAFHILERVIIGWIHGESIAAAIPAIGGGGISGLLCVAAILFVSLIPRFAFWGLSRELGRDRMRKILFGIGT